MSDPKDAVRENWLHAGRRIQAGEIRAESARHRAAELRRIARQASEAEERREAHVHALLAFGQAYNVLRSGLDEAAVALEDGDLAYAREVIEALQGMPDIPKRPGASFTPVYCRDRITTPLMVWAMGVER